MATVPADSPAYHTHPNHHTGPRKSLKGWLTLGIAIGSIVAAALGFYTRAVMETQRVSQTVDELPKVLREQSIRMDKEARDRATFEASTTRILDRVTSVQEAQAARQALMESQYVSLSERTRLSEMALVKSDTQNTAIQESLRDIRAQNASIQAALVRIEGGKPRTTQGN